MILGIFEMDYNYLIIITTTDGGLKFMKQMDTITIGMEQQGNSNQEMIVNFLWNLFYVLDLNGNGKMLKKDLYT